MKLTLLSKPNKVCILYSTQLTLEMQLADLAIQLDEKMLFEQYQVDAVCLVINDIPVDYQKILDSQLLDDSVYYIDNDCIGNFYCRPYVLSVLSSLYKIDFAQLHFKNLKVDTSALLAEKILYLINRLGYEFYV